MTAAEVKSALCKLLSGLEDVAKWTPTTLDDEIISFVHGVICEPEPMAAAADGVTAKPKFKILRKLTARFLAQKKGITLAEAQALLDAKFADDAAFVAEFESRGVPVGKLGDGTILKLLIDNLPAIIAAIMQIISLFA